MQNQLPNSLSSKSIGDVQNALVRVVLGSTNTLSTTADRKKYWKDTLNFFNNSCAYCGNHECKLVADHVIPINRKFLGRQEVGNIVPSCNHCNSVKGGNDIIGDLDSRQNFISKKIKASPELSEETLKNNIEIIQKIFMSDIKNYIINTETKFDLTNFLEGYRSQVLDIAEEAALLLLLSERSSKRSMDSYRSVLKRLRNYNLKTNQRPKYLKEVFQVSEIKEKKKNKKQVIEELKKIEPKTAPTLARRYFDINKI